MLCHYYRLTHCTVGFLINASLLVICSLIALSDSVSNRPSLVTSCCSLRCIVYFVTKQLYFVLLLLTKNKRENKEVGSQMKQHWLVTLTSLTRLTSSDMSLISWRQASQPAQPDQPDGTWWDLAGLPWSGMVWSGS